MEEAVLRPLSVLAMPNGLMLHLPYAFREYFYNYDDQKCETDLAKVH